MNFAVCMLYDASLVFILFYRYEEDPCYTSDFYSFTLLRLVVHCPRMCMNCLNLLLSANVFYQLHPEGCTGGEWITARREA